MQRLSQQLKQLQKLSPQQIQLMKLLQVPTALLDERIKEEIEENPALEVDVEEYEDKTLDEKTNEEIKDEFLNDENEDYVSDDEGDEFGNIDITEYVKEGDDEDADYNFQSDNFGADEEDKVGYQHKLETTFYDHLMAQVNMLNLEEREQQVANFIIGSIEDDGYLRRDIPSIIDDMSFRQNIQTNEKELNKIIKYIQEFEPAGVAARDLQECLLLQLRKKEKNKSTQLAIKIIETYFDEFTKKHYEKIQRALVLNDEDLKEVIQIIIKLNPKPGALFSTTNKLELYVIPDFYVYNNNGVLEVSLNQKNAPDLRVSSTFRDMLKDYDRGDKKDNRQKEAVLFIKQKIDSAKWFIDAVKQRQETLMLTMTRILNLQEDFFLTGDETSLKPMILKDISDRTGLDISTISRVVNSKYVQTEFGTFKLKYFFSESMSTDSGEEVSTREVKMILNEIISGEEKKQPYSDEKLTDMLNEKGYNIARRTVAKYREQLNLPVARLRKEL
ncbi:MAG: RNA polymerase factor sigma-54 [Bacteroidetes bacterium]|jgi:RNA polymerase sigma-54 factor|nr:RNA polymerase factor sigma-54 [Bacteroidota bacterium]MBK6820662.1 RNA polymerase factor sigma-54 [Bacteroidota bacterium]MBK8329558.1 RNA polymerase factor sigma-54 [Bacteroidota bacterium]MBK9481198.1 RNA polymerase factor sigma-54 [Bacteroidota bacterium]